MLRYKWRRTNYILSSLKTCTIVPVNGYIPEIKIIFDVLSSVYRICNFCIPSLIPTTTFLPLPGQHELVHTVQSAVRVLRVSSEPIKTKKIVLAYKIYLNNNLYFQTKLNAHKIVRYSSHWERICGIIVGVRFPENDEQSILITNARQFISLFKNDKNRDNSGG